MVWLYQVWLYQVAEDDTPDAQPVDGEWCGGYDTREDAARDGLRAHPGHSILVAPGLRQLDPSDLAVVDADGVWRDVVDNAFAMPRAACDDLRLAPSADELHNLVVRIDEVMKAWAAPIMERRPFWLVDEDKIEHVWPHGHGEHS